MSCVRSSRGCLSACCLVTSHITSGPIVPNIDMSIDSKLSRSCKAVFHKRTLGPCLRWIDDYLIPWLCIAFGCDDSSQDDFIYPWRTRLIRHFHRCFFGLRVSELFEIIVEFPYSRCALLDLLESLKVTDRSELLVSSLSKSIGKRLLQPGATTATIVDFYIALQKSVLLLDPVGAMTQTLGDPIKQYLRQRSDTVKCIISKLIDSPGSEGGQHDDGNNDLAVESEEGPLPESIVRNLLSIYDTYDVFVKEFQSSLASRLCRLPNYDTVLEMAQVEHLKTRIDESNLQNCEVMLRDIFDSKRIDSLIHETGFFKQVPLHSRILSRQYWPPLEQEMFKLPDAVQSQMEEYQKMYGDIKQGRALKWIPSAGTVSLTLDLKDRRLTLDVTPFQASIISCFENQAEWTLAKLAAHLETSDSTLKKRMAYWIKMNVISEPADGVYRLIEELDPLAHDAEVKSAFVPANDAHGRPAQRTTAEPEEMWAFHIQTIMGLFPALTAEELLQKMQMMSFNGNVDNVKALLQVLVVDGKVKACGQTYSLKQ
ncbi:uncharacterized protein BJ171DRAFT_73494 [Polychytrium aggregatum]|uniref:uncharacterized protein n=1 Tax=Polychytrium aggregatum TaxID=110093 RepID=UPI0022FE868E|nr:uncharacterized protein BJ171DRAFT_73494 [Polychytrium aggregatum]KAI9205433.1 hypothetical protein BJ171DRAFT_73494 [Polychytrium aggregatum]